MKKLFQHFSFLLLAGILFSSCKKENYFTSEKGIKSDLQGTWRLIPIPRFTIDNNHDTIFHVESWSFDNQNVTITNNGVTGVSTYSVETSWSKAVIKIESITQLDGNIYNASWQIVRIDDDFLVIANDKDGTTGLTQYEFEKSK